MSKLFTILVFLGAVAGAIAVGLLVINNQEIKGNRVEIGGARDSVVANRKVILHIRQETVTNDAVIRAQIDTVNARVDTLDHRVNRVEQKVKSLNGWRRDSEGS